MIVDNLDRVDSRAKTRERTQPEYLFVDRGEQLRKLSCHFSKTYAVLGSKSVKMVDRQ